MEQMHEVQIERTRDRMTITIIRPPDNMLSESMLRKIADALETLRGDDDIKLIVFASGVSGVFSKGFHYRDRSPEQVGTLISAFGHLLYVLNEIPIISVCEVDGPCLGGSLELATFCDILVASEASTFGHPEIKAGIFPPIAAALYPHLMGRNRTIELLATGREFSAAEAFNLGIVNRMLPTAEFAVEVEKFYSDIERNSAFTLRLTKKAIESALYEKVLVAIRTTETIYLNELLPSHDAREGIQAAAEGRAARWKNR